MKTKHMKTSEKVMVVTLLVLITVHMFWSTKRITLNRDLEKEQARVDSLQSEYDSLKAYSDTYYVRMVNWYEYRIKKEQDRVEALIGKPNFNRK